MKALSTFLLVILCASFVRGQAVSYSYDNMGNRTARNAGGGGTTPTNCYTIQLPSPPYDSPDDRKLTNFGGVVKVKSSVGSGNSQIWQVENVGTQVRISSWVSNQVLGVESGGNSVGNPITLQSSGPEDHKLWTRTPLGSGLEALVRKNSTYRMGSAYNWGNGNANNAIPDIQLADDPSGTFGSNKWQFVSTTCPAARTSAEDLTAIIPVPVVEIAPNLESIEALTAFPNPSSGAFEAQFHLASGQRATLSLNDMLGREVWRKAVVGEGIQREKITLYEAAAGTYLLVLRREGVGPRSVGSQRAVESKRVLIVK